MLSIKSEFVSSCNSIPRNSRRLFKIFNNLPLTSFISKPFLTLKPPLSSKSNICSDNELIC